MKIYFKAWKSYFGSIFISIGIVVLLMLILLNETTSLRFFYVNALSIIALGILFHFLKGKHISDFNIVENNYEITYFDNLGNEKIELFPMSAKFTVFKRRTFFKNEIQIRVYNQNRFTTFDVLNDKLLTKILDSCLENNYNIKSTL